MNNIEENLFNLFLNQSTFSERHMSEEKDIICLKASKSYTYLSQKKNKVLSSKALGFYEKSNPGLFFRCHDTPY